MADINQDPFAEYRAREVSRIHLDITNIGKLAAHAANNGTDLSIIVEQLDELQAALNIARNNLGEIWEHQFIVS